MLGPPQFHGGRFFIAPIGRLSSMKFLSLAAMFLAGVVSAAETEPLFRFDLVLNTRGGNNGHFSADAKLFAVEDKSGIMVWNTETGIQTGLITDDPERCAKKSPQMCGIRLVALSPDGEKIVLERFDEIWRKPKLWRVSTVELWDVQTEVKIRVLAEKKNLCRESAFAFTPWDCPRVLSTGFSPDGKSIPLSFSTNRLIRAFPDYKANHWEHFEGERLDLMDHRLLNINGETRALKGPGFYTADGRLLTIRVNGNKSASIRDGDGKKVSFLQGYNDISRDWRVTPDGSTLAFHFLNRFKGSDGKKYAIDKMVVWDVATGKLLREVSHELSGLERIKMGLTPDGRWLVHAHTRKVQAGSGVYKYEVDRLELTAYDLRIKGPKRVQVLKNPMSIYGLRFLPGSNYLAGLNGRVWRLSADAAPVAAAPRSAPVARMNVDTPPISKMSVDPNAYAIVIGIEKYRQKGIPKVDYAARDAATMHRYLTKSMGFDPANVVLLQNEQATRSDLRKYLGPWLKNRVSPKSRVFIYYAGHGAPNPVTGHGYLVPYEGDPNYTKTTGFAIQGLYDTLAKLSAKEITVVLDACFSGAGARSLLAKGARPLVNRISAKAARNISVISAASGAQISASYPQGRHGLLTYFLLKGLHGAADSNKNGAVTTSELLEYARPAVEIEARKQNIEQTPSLTGPGNTVWLKR